MMQGNKKNQNKVIDVRLWDEYLLSSFAEKIEGVKLDGTSKIKLHAYGLTIVFRPRIVQINEVAAYAKKNCKTCAGKGFFVTKSSDQERFIATCGCAGKRFQKMVPMLKDQVTKNWIALDNLHYES